MMRTKEYVKHCTFRCDTQTDKMMNEIMSNSHLTKSEVIRESIKHYYKRNRRVK